MPGSAEMGEALEQLVQVLDILGSGVPRAFSLEYTGGVTPPGEPWLCAVEVDAKGGEFEIWGSDPVVVVRNAVERLRAIGRH